MPGAHTASTIFDISVVDFVFADWISVDSMGYTVHDDTPPPRRNTPSSREQMNECTGALLPCVGKIARGLGALRLVWRKKMWERICQSVTRAYPKLFFFYGLVTGLFFAFFVRPRCGKAYNASLRPRFQPLNLCINTNIYTMYFRRRAFFSLGRYEAPINTWF